MASHHFHSPLIIIFLNFFQNFFFFLSFLIPISSSQRLNSRKFLLKVGIREITILALYLRVVKNIVSNELVLECSLSDNMKGSGQSVNEISPLNLISCAVSVGYLPATPGAFHPIPPPQLHVCTTNIQINLLRIILLGPF